VYGGDADVKYGLEKGSIWKLDPTTGKAIRWAQIDDSIDPDGSGGQALDKTDSGYKAYGWESSGIIDVSNLYGHAPGTDFFANVQTHGVKGGAIADFNLAAGGQILKLEASVKKTELTYTPVGGGTPIKATFRPTSGELVGAVEFNRLIAAPTISNKPNTLEIGQTGINFSLKVNDSGATSTRSEASTVVDLKPLLDGLTTTNKRLAYFVYDTPVAGAAPVATPFTWDPTKKGGAQFYDLDSDGIAETVNLTFIDGGYGDKDGVKNGVIVDPSTPGVSDIKPVFGTTAGSQALTVADPSDSISPAAILLKVSLSAKADSVNQIGFVALNAGESDTITYEQLRDRGTIIQANLEKEGTPSLSAINLEKTISVINGQKIVFFEAVDTTLVSLLGKNTSIATMGASFRILDLSKTNDSQVIASKGGNSVTVALHSATTNQGLGDLISSKMGENSILDFSGLSGRDITGTVSMAREASYDSTIGFYRIQGADGSVLDPITNTLITPGSAGYQAAALSATNLFTGFGSLSVANLATRTDTISDFRDAGMLAPYATVKQTGDTWFSFKAANSDGLDHFRTLGSGSIGLEDFRGGFDQDFDDNIVSFNFKLAPTLA
ncbi:MAG: DUF4114 domain-containing protein, partial [Synechococcus sp.]